MANPHDMKAATGTYEGFITTVKWSVPLLAVLTLIIVVLIAP